MRVACIGAGYFAQFHYDAWRRIEGVELVGACDLDIEKAQKTGARAFDDLAEMLEAVKPDILDIVTPPPSHFISIDTALRRGVKAIICQKPFCRNLGEARAAIAEAEAADVPIIIHENFRFQPWYRLIKKMVDQGDLGNILNCSFHLRTGDGQGPEAYLDRQPYFQTMPRLLVHETGVHFIDLFRFFLGDPVAGYADMRRLNPVIAGEDAAFFSLDFLGGAQAIFEGNRLLDHATENCRVTLGEARFEGTRGTLDVRGDGSVLHRNFGEPKPREIMAPNELPGFGGDCVHALCAHVVAGLETGEFENTAQDYLRVIEIEDALYESAKGGRKVEL